MTDMKRGGKRPSVKVGDVLTTNEGYEVEVFEYRHYKDVMIRFLDGHGHECRVTVNNLQKHQVKNPYHRSVFGVGYVGVGEYKRYIDGKSAKVYRSWVHILERSYCPKYLDRFPTYKDCSVDGRWHNFQVFAEWYYQQPNSSTKDFALDKDLLVFGNKVYGPDACTFVPREVNTLLTNSTNTTGNLPKGVSTFKNKYKAEMSMYGKKKNLGYYLTPEEAYFRYRSAKEVYVKEIAERYKEYLHPQVYSNLMDWELEDLEAALNGE